MIAVSCWALLVVTCLLVKEPFSRQTDGPLQSFESSSSASASSGASLRVDRSRNLNLTRSQIRDINTELESATGFKLTEASDALILQPIDSSSNIITNSMQRRIDRILTRNIGRSVTTSRDRSRNSSSATATAGSVRPNPGSLYPENQFFDFVRAQIISGSTKLLASPTLILQENPAELRC